MSFIEYVFVSQIYQFHNSNTVKYKYTYIKTEIGKGYSQLVN